MTNSTKIQTAQTVIEKFNYLGRDIYIVRFDRLDLNKHWFNAYITTDKSLNNYFYFIQNNVEMEISFQGYRKELLGVDDFFYGLTTAFDCDFNTKTDIISKSKIFVERLNDTVFCINHLLQAVS